MTITFSVPKKQLKKHKNALSEQLKSAIPEAKAFLDIPNGYLVLDLAPDADPIDVIARLRRVTAPFDIAPVRVQGDACINNRPVIHMVGTKPVRTVKMSQHVISIIAIALVCSLLSFFLAAMVFVDPSDAFSPTLGVGEEQSEDFAAKIAIVDTLFKEYALKDANGDYLLDQMLRAYISATGDRYAAYYTEDEFNALLADMEGSATGIGVTVTWDPEQNAIRVIKVVSGSPAEEADVKVGDLVVAVGAADASERVSEIGYEAAMKKLRGAENTNAEFIISRNGVEQAKSVTRKAFEAVTVEGEKSVTASGVGIVCISGFDANTPKQFKAVMEKLLNEQCTRFVYDVRNNPGGELKSVCAVLSYFANEGDILVSTVSKQEETVYYKAQAVSYTNYPECSVTKEEIGQYRRYPAVVLANGNTASAGELFTAALRDFGLADVVGEQTYGKGVLQSVIPLSTLGAQYGMELSGGLKLTVGYYTPPSGVNYDGVGILPTGDPVSLPPNTNLYLLDEAQDAQLLAAIDNVKTK